VSIPARKPDGTVNPCYALPEALLRGLVAQGVGWRVMVEGTVQAGPVNGNYGYGCTLPDAVAAAGHPCMKPL
jgi:hypothetical protein